MPHLDHKYGNAMDTINYPWCGARQKCWRVGRNAVKDHRWSWNVWKYRLTCVMTMMSVWLTITYDNWNNIYCLHSAVSVALQMTARDHGVISWVGNKVFMSLHVQLFRTSNNKYTSNRDIHTYRLNGYFSRACGLASCTLILFPSTVPKTASEDNWHRILLWARCPSCHPTNSVNIYDNISFGFNFSRKYINHIIGCKENK